MSVTTFTRNADSLIAFEGSFVGDDHTKGSINSYIKQLDILWSQISSSYDACVKKLDKSCSELRDQEVRCDDDAKVKAIQKQLSDTKDTVLTVEYKYFKVFALYSKFNGRLIEILESMTPAAEVPINSSSGPSCSDPKLPPCDLQPFDGSYLAWPTFRDLFTALYIQNSRLSNIEKLFHLINKTRKDARDIVERVPLTNDGFGVAWNDLRAAYENKRELTDVQFNKFSNLPFLQAEDGVELKHLQRSVNSCLSALSLLGHTDLWNAFVVYHCSLRLPKETLVLWEHSIKDKNTAPKWEELDNFLTNRHQSLEHIAGMQRPTTLGHKSPLHRSIKSHATNVSDKQKPQPCSLCPRQSHSLRQCPKFKSMDVKSKQRHVREHQFCFNCLASSHMVKQCTSKYSCMVCQQKHHSWLHENPVARESPSMTNQATAAYTHPTPSTSNKAGLNVHANSFHVQTVKSPLKTVILGTANVLVTHRGTTFQARALLDSASEASFITNTLRKRLGIPVRSTNVTISGVDGRIATTSSNMCTFSLSSPNDKLVQIECTAFVLPRITGNLPACPVTNMTGQEISNLTLADDKFYNSAPVDLLIGGDLYPMIVLKGVQHNVLGSLLAQETVFGWVLTGSLSVAHIQTHATMVLESTHDAIDDQIKKFWELEEIPKRKFLTDSEKYCEEFYKRTTTRNANGRYVVSLPFREEMTPEDRLGVSRPLALRQFLRNEASLLKKPEVKLLYDQVIREYAELEHMEPVSSDMNPKINYYLPHHAVSKPESTTTSLRVVFNASSSSTNGRSLNDVLHTGPALQADLTCMLLKWLFKYVFSCDITKMYRQILINPSQYQFQRILHRNSPSDVIQDYQLKTVTFGVNCAPFLAIRTLLQLAQDVQSTHPLAEQILRNHMYVDDVLAGYHDIHIAKKAQQELIEALRSAGFSLRKWTANTKLLLDDLPSDHLLDKAFLEFEDSSMSKTLGMRWNAIQDEFFFIAHPIQCKQSFTKREVLSTIAKLFDPAGWLAPIVIVAKSSCNKYG